ncbi:MAG: PAS domain S-box protein [Geobacter sp.]|nr:PAS domain S-box protein [Geobacter sp.]
MRSIIHKLFGESEIERLTAENRSLREANFRQIEYIRKKTNQMLLLFGTLPIRPEEPAVESLIDSDPIGVMTESFIQILEHEKHLNERVRAAHDETQAILASVGVGIMVLDSNMKIQIYNQRLLEMFSVAEEGLTEKTCCQAICQTDSYPANCAFERVMNTRRPVHQVDWVMNKRHFEVSAVPVKNRFGDVTQVVMAYMDITNRVKTELHLREKEQMYLDVFENAGEMVQCVAPDGSFIFVNRLWRENLGYSSDEISGLKIWNIIAPESRSVCMEHFGSLMKGERLSEVETVFFSKECKELPVKGHVTISYSDGKPLATFGMFHVTNT